MKHFLECLIYLLNQNKNIGVNVEEESSKYVLFKTEYSNILHGCDFLFKRDELLMSLRSVCKT